jgi:FtsZ-binding cell division protein ZapB
MDIIITLKHQLDLSETKHRESILQLQAENMAARVEELSKATEHFREERHNFRHKMKTISSLAHNKQYDALEELLDEYGEAMNSTQIVRYCNNAVLDAVISAYIKQAEGRGIRISYGFDFPDPIPVNTTEFATVLANALENAIQACDKLPPEERFIEMRVLSRPRFMLMIKNSFNGTIQFDENDIPINREDGHGFGTRTIIAFCEKHRAFYRFVAEGKEFALYLNFQQIV